MTGRNLRSLTRMTVCAAAAAMTLLFTVSVEAGPRSGGYTAHGGGFGGKTWHSKGIRGFGGHGWKGGHSWKGKGWKGKGWKGHHGGKHKFRKHAKQPVPRYREDRLSCRHLVHKLEKQYPTAHWQRQLTCHYHQKGGFPYAATARGGFTGGR